MIKKWYLFLFCFLLFLSNCSINNSPDAGDDRFSRVDKIFAAWDRSDSPGCALGIIHNGQFIYKRGYGIANLETQAPINTNSVFRIASTSKQFTAMCIALLEEDGKLSLDDDIRIYVPEIPDYGTPIRIYHLIYHTSGLQDYLRYCGETDTEEDILNILSNLQTLNHPTGESWKYTNSGYFLLGVIVKRVSGNTLRQFAEKNIFQPLNMTSTFFNDDTSKDDQIQNLAIGYYKTETGEYVEFMTQLDIVGDGSLFTTVEDLFKWDQNFYHNILGKGDQSLIDRVLTVGTLDDGSELPVSYAFGLFIDTFKGRTSVSHGGSFVGYRAEMFRLPGENFTVICLFNLADTKPMDLVKNVAEIFIE
jgi:CubicO group peptidase (beta-lactamase class C family)